MHARTASLSRMTVAPPQRPWPQPSFVPVNPSSSRRSQSNERSGSPSQFRCWPLILRLIMIVTALHKLPVCFGASENMLLKRSTPSPAHAQTVSLSNRRPDRATSLNWRIDDHLLRLFAAWFTGLFGEMDALECTRKRSGSTSQRVVFRFRLAKAGHLRAFFLLYDQFHHAPHILLRCLLRQRRGVRDRRNVRRRRHRRTDGVRACADPVEASPSTSSALSGTVPWLKGFTGQGEIGEHMFGI